MLSHPVRFRRLATATSLFAAGVFNTVAFAVWPWGRDGSEEAFAQGVVGSSSASEIGPLLLHYGLIALAASIIGLFEMLRPEGGIWGHLAGCLAFVGTASFIPIAQIFWFLLAADTVGVPAGQLTAIAEAYPGQLPSNAIFLPAVFCTLIAVPVFLLALWRSGFLPWWPAVVMFAGMGLPILLPYGVFVSTMAAAVQAVALIYVGWQVLDLDDRSQSARNSLPRAAARPKGTTHQEETA
jgi:hypothetical protein